MYVSEPSFQSAVHSKFKSEIHEQKHMLSFLAVEKAGSEEKWGGGRLVNFFVHAGVYKTAVERGSIICNLDSAAPIIWLAGKHKCSLTFFHRKQSNSDVENYLHFTHTQLYTIFLWRLNPDVWGNNSLNVWALLLNIWEDAINWLKQPAGSAMTWIKKAFRLFDSPTLIPSSHKSNSRWDSNTHKNSTWSSPVIPRWFAIPDHHFAK